jgi:group I intron endonuclease
MRMWFDLTDLAAQSIFRDKPGIYVFCNMVNRKKYVGSSGRVGKRIMCHLSALRKGEHRNKHLQAAWDKYNSRNIKIFLIEIVSNFNFLEEREQYWLDHFDSHKNGYNNSPVAGIARGFTFHHTESAKLKISLAKIGMGFSAQHKKRLSVARKAYKQSRITVEKTRRANMGNKRSADAKRRIALARQNNISKTNETVRKSKIREPLSGFKGVYKHRDKWQAKINVNGKDFSVGRFLTQKEAAHNYDYHMKYIYGTNCFLNFPDHSYDDFCPKKPALFFEPKKTQKAVPKKISKKKLNQVTALEIREKHRNGTAIKDLAKQHGVTFASISRIVNNLVYKEDHDIAAVSVVYNISTPDE